MIPLKHTSDSSDYVTPQFKAISLESHPESSYFPGYGSSWTPCLFSSFSLCLTPCWPPCCSSNMPSTFLTQHFVPIGPSVWNAFPTPPPAPIYSQGFFPSFQPGLRSIVICSEKLTAVTLWKIVPLFHHFLDPYLVFLMGLIHTLKCYCFLF